MPGKEGSHGAKSRRSQGVAYRAHLSRRPGQAVQEEAHVGSIAQRERVRGSGHAPRGSSSFAARPQSLAPHRPKCEKARMAADNPATPPQVQIQLQIDEQTAQGMYVNMAMLNHNETEFVIDFIYVQPQAPKAVVRARVINSPKHMKRLLHALQDNVAKYEAQFGKIDVSGALPPTLGMPH